MGGKSSLPEFDSWVKDFNCGEQYGKKC